MPRAIFVQCAAGDFAAAAAALLSQAPGSRLHADGAHACGVQRLVRWNKVHGRPSQAGVDEILYLPALNAYDWHTVLIGDLVREASIRDPSCIVVTGLLGAYLTERLKEPERLAFVRHSLDALNELALLRPVYVLEDYSRCSRIDAVATAKARVALAEPCRAEVAGSGFRLVPLADAPDVQHWTARRPVLPALPGLHQ